MPSIDKGIRPGVEEDKVKALGPGFQYVRSTHPGFEEIRKNDREVQRYEAEVKLATQKLEVALLQTRIAFVLMHGGAVDKGLLARAGIDVKADPHKVLNTIVRDLPVTLNEKAVLSQ